MALDLFIGEMLSRISDAKIKDGVFVGPHTRELIQDVLFEDSYVK
jgi:hypothetical protein